MFRTELHPKDPGFKLELKDRLLTIGSCFSDVIGRKLQENKFKVAVNPFGTLFHPTVCAKLLQMALAGKIPGKETYLNYEGRWVCYLLHSSINAPDPDKLQEKLHAIFGEVNRQIRSARALMLTSGTAYLFEHEELGLGVANCHRQPQKLFRKRLSSVEELTQNFTGLYADLKAARPDIKIIVTVSPVRHLKETLELNSVSKATLRLFTHQLSLQYPEVSYFPSYELLLDDLRDYRFYGRDLLHPSEEAEEYIWQKFTTTFFNQETLDFIKEWESIRKALAHRPFNPESEAHQQFIRKTIHKLEHFPYQPDVQDEIMKLKSQLL